MRWGGEDKVTASSNSSYSWLLGYTQDLAPHLAGSFCYLNEGHFLGHRRDGYAPQIWARTDLWGDRINLGVGAGPCLFFDTQDRADGNFDNKHGLRTLVSLEASWRTESNLLLLLRSNYVTGGRDPDTVSVLAGIGYQFENVGRDETIPLERADNEITLFLGQTIANSLDSQRSVATAIEYRRTLVRHIDWTLALLDEGDNRLYRRDGVVTQLWATQELGHLNRITVGAGVGAFFDIKHYQSSVCRVLGIAALTQSICTAAFVSLPRMTATSDANK